MRSIAVDKLDLFHPMMEEYFMANVAKLTPEEVASIPQEIRFKLFNQGFQQSTYSMKFAEKAHILTTTLGKDMIILFQDEENGIGPDQFEEAVRAQKAKITNGKLLSDRKTKSIFLLGNKELMTPLLYLNHVMCSDIYSLIQEPVMRVKTKKERDHVKLHTAYKGITEMLTFYEGNKKMIPQAFGIDMPGWYSLLYFGVKEKKGTDFYNGDFKYAYSSSRVKLYAGLKKMYDRGYLNRRGARNDLRYSLSAKGADLLYRIIDKLILSYKN